MPLTFAGKETPKAPATGVFNTAGATCSLGQCKPPNTTGAARRGTGVATRKCLGLTHVLFAPLRLERAGQLLYQPSDLLRRKAALGLT